jgi:hypothetical protein
MTTKTSIPVSAFEPGKRIMWTHGLPDGTAVLRYGEVWDRGPSVSGATVTAWVIPDEPLDTDAYVAIAVGKATRDHSANGPHTSGPWIRKGTTFSSSRGLSPLGSLTESAAAFARSVRQKNQTSG